MSDTPRTKAATRMAFTSEYMVEIEEAQKMERELNDALTALAMLGDKHERELAEAKEKMLNNPFCASCKESNCCVSGDGTCAMIRKYLKADETTKQRDELAANLKSLCRAIISGEPREITGLLKQSGLALSATKGGGL